MYRSVDALSAIDVRTLTEAAESQGAGAVTILFRVILPNIRSAILSGAFLTFAIVMGAPQDFCSEPRFRGQMKNAEF